MTAEEKQKRATEIAEELQGTCNDLHSALKEGEENDEELLKFVDDDIFCCDQCGWWCEIGEQSERDDDQICEDCNNE